MKYISVKELLGRLRGSLSLPIGTPPFTSLPLRTDLVLLYDYFLHQLSLRQILMLRNKKHWQMTLNFYYPIFVNVTVKLSLYRSLTLD